MEFLSLSWKECSFATSITPFLTNPSSALLSNSQSIHSFDGIGKGLNYNFPSLLLCLTILFLLSYSLLGAGAEKPIPIPFDLPHGSTSTFE